MGNLRVPLALLSIGITTSGIAADPAARPQPVRDPAAQETAAQAEDDSDDVEIVFIPSLSALLLRAEQLNKGELTREQVEKIRDEASVVALPRDTVRALEKSRGYKDIDPERAWGQWKVLRIEMAITPELAKKIAVTTDSDK